MKKSEIILTTEDRKEVYPYSSYRVPSVGDFITISDKKLFKVNRRLFDIVNIDTIVLIGEFI